MTTPTQAAPPDVEGLLRLADRIEQLEPSDFNWESCARGSAHPKCIAGWDVFWSTAVGYGSLQSHMAQKYGLTDDESSSIVYGTILAAMLGGDAPSDLPRLDWDASVKDPVAAARHLRDVARLAGRRAVAAGEPKK